MITAMMTKKARIGQRLALSALVFAALAAGTLLTGCEQTASSSPTRNGQLTVNGTPAGVYVASIYKPMEGLAINQGSDWDTGLWAKATDSSLLVASGVVTADGGKAVIPLSTPAGGDFTGDRAFLAVISPASPHEPPELKHYSITDFTAGRAAVNWKKSDGYTSEVYTITFHIDGSSFYLEVPLRGEVLEPKLEQPTGYDFDGWYTKPDYTETYDFGDEKTNKVTGNLDLYARWLPIGSSHTVTFYLNYDNNDTAQYGDSQTIAHGGKVTPPTDPTREGLAFIAWVTKDTEGTETEWDFSTPVTRDLTLYATWTDVFYTVTFNLNGATGTPPPKENIPHDKPATRPDPDPTQTGYRFDGWYTESTCETPWDFGKDTVKGNITLYAKWTRTYTVTFYRNYGTDVVHETQSIPEGNTAKPPVSNPTQEGWGFVGWYTQKNEGSKYDFAAPVTSNLDLYAHWTQKSYTVTFRLNYGGATGTPVPQTIAHGAEVNEPAPEPTRTGYRFDGWFQNKEGNGTAWDFSTDTVTEPITLYAKWTQNIYTVMFHLNYSPAPGTPPPQTIAHGGTVTRPLSDPTRTAFTFDDWYTDDDWYTEANEGEKYVFNTPVTGNLQLYAKWTQNPVVSFYVDGVDHAVYSVDVPPGRKVKEPTATDISLPTNYDLDGWYKDDRLTYQYNFDEPVTEGLDLYARWTLGSFAKAIAVMEFDKNIPEKTYYLKNVSGSVLPENYSAAVSLTAGATSPASVTINGDGRTVTGNSNSITVGSGVTLTLKNITFNNILFTVSGGTLVLGDNVTINKTSGNGVEVNGGTLTMNSGASINGNNGTGVGVIVSAGLFNMTGGTISANKGNEYGGGVRVNGNGAVFNMSGGLIYGNTASPSFISGDNYISHPGSGGGVYVSGSGAVFTMSGGLISGNIAKADTVNTFNHPGSGGGVYVSGSGAVFNMRGNAEISGNKTEAIWAGGGEGGGVYVKDGAVFTMEGGKITNNTTSLSNDYLGAGGGVCVIDGAEFNMSGTTTTTVISGNNAGYGGGVCLFDNSTFTMTGGSITENLADVAPVYGGSSDDGGFGGGVFIGYYSSFAMNGGEISVNTAEDFGGGVYKGLGGNLTGNPSIGGTTPPTDGKGWIHGNTATNNPATKDSN